MEEKSDLFKSLQSARQQLQAMEEKLNVSKTEFHKNSLLLSATLFGVLVALHDKNLHNQQANYLFALACIALACGIPILAFALYGRIKEFEAHTDKYRLELKSALQTYRPPKSASVKLNKLTSVLILVPYILFLLAIALLVSYLVCIYF
jgi:Na+/melibiose symporter-like transporter